MIGDVIEALLPGFVFVLGLVFSMYAYTIWIRPFFRWIKRTSPVGWAYTSISHLQRYYDRSNTATLTGRMIGVGRFGIVIVRAVKRDD